MPQKKVVRYLGVHLDFKLNHNEHVKLQIDKAQRAFTANKRIFHSKNLDNGVKLLQIINPSNINLWLSHIIFNISASWLTM